MAKTVLSKVRLQISAGKATPAPPVGPALGQHGVNIMDFCKAFNKLTANELPDTIVPVVVTIYTDRTFSFITKKPPVSFLIKKLAGVEKGSGEARKKFVGRITRAQVEEIARIKFPDLNARDIKGAVKIVEGTALSMGIEIE